jgi:hypothetical protein
LSEYGNFVSNDMQVFMKSYCATMPPDVVKPGSMDFDRVRQWIETVYVSKAYYKEDVSRATGQDSRGPRHVENISPDDIAVVPLSDILGSKTPILKFSLRPEEANDGANGAATEEVPCEAKVEQVGSEANLLGDWDPFGIGPNDSQDDAVTQKSIEQEEKHVDPTPTGDNIKVSNGENASLILEESESTFQAEWDSFVSFEASEQTVQTESQPEEELAVDKHEEKSTMQEPPKPEVPLDAFYPEFEQIRATGMLPTGAPVPWNIRMADIGQLPAQTVTAPVYQEPSSRLPHAMPKTAKPEPQRTADANSLRSASTSANRAIRTLYGEDKSLTAYDLSAPFAPKPQQHGGNPFA